MKYFDKVILIYYQVLQIVDDSSFVSFAKINEINKE